MIHLIVDFDDELGFWYFVVKENGQVVCFRPGFRTEAQAADVGNQWIKDMLGGIPEASSEPDATD